MNRDRPRRDQEHEHHGLHVLRSPTRRRPDGARTFARRATTDRLTELEADGTRHDPALWRDLADADLLGLALPESVGGSGRGFLELGLLLAEVGWSVAPVPAYATLALGADAIARYGTPEQINGTYGMWSKETESSPRV